MPSPNQRTGKVYIRIDGVLYESNKGATLEDFAGVRRPPQVGTDVFGFTEEAVPAKVTAEFAHGSGLSLEALAAIVNSTLTFECDSGPTFILRNAWYGDSMKLTGGTGWLGCVFYAKRAVEQGVTTGVVNS